MCMPLYFLYNVTLCDACTYSGSHSHVPVKLCIPYRFTYLFSTLHSCVYADRQYIQMHAVTHASLHKHAGGLDTDQLAEVAEQLAEVATAGQALDCVSVLQEVERQHPGFMTSLQLIGK